MANSFSTWVTAVNICCIVSCSIAIPAGPWSVERLTFPTQELAHTAQESLLNTEQSASNLATPSAQLPTPADIAKACHDKLQGLQSLSATISVAFPGDAPQIWKVEFKKPNLYRIVAPDQEYRSDGQIESVYLPISNTYQYTDRRGAQINDAPFCYGLNWFFTGSLVLPVQGMSPSTADDQNSYALTFQEPGFAGLTTLYIDTKTFLPIGYEEPVGEGKILKVRYSELRLNPTFSPNEFVWVPPAGSKPVQQKNLESSMLPPGTAAPAPTVLDMNGNVLNLGQQFATHKTTLLYFWKGLPPYPNVPALKELYATMKDQRLQIVLIDSNASEPAIREALGDQVLPFPIVIDEKGSLAKAYGVQAPSEYLVGADGHVGSHFLGYDADGIAKDLRQRGFRI